jgi:hypothetical protein
LDGARRCKGKESDLFAKDTGAVMYPASKVQPFPDDDLLGRINAVDLEHVLRDIQTDCGNLHVDGSLCGL